MYERKTQKRINKNSLLKLVMHGVSFLMFCMPDIIQPRKMQIQAYYCKITLKERTVEDGQLAHEARPLLD